MRTHAFFVFENLSKTPTNRNTNQLPRRNITDDQRVYLIGKRYKEEKITTSFKGNQHTVKKDAISQNVPNPRTAEKIAEQNKVSHMMVKRAEKFANAVDEVAKNTGIDAQKILSGDISYPAGTSRMTRGRT